MVIAHGSSGPGLMVGAVFVLLFIIILFYFFLSLLGFSSSLSFFLVCADVTLPLGKSFRRELLIVWLQYC